MRNTSNRASPLDPDRPVLFSDFVAHLRILPEEAIRAFYWLARHDPTLDRLAIINAGCSDDEVEATEERVRHAFHPLHRLILSLSNGGTIPFVRLSCVAAAVPREREWRIAGPFLTPEELAVRPMMNVREVQPIQSMILGTPLRARVGDALANQYRLDELISIAPGYGSEEYCYVRGDPNRIKAFKDYFGAGAVVDNGADDFVEFIGCQSLYAGCGGDKFIALMGDALHAIQEGRDDVP